MADELLRLLLLGSKCHCSGGFPSPTRWVPSLPQAQALAKLALMGSSGTVNITSVTRFLSLLRERLRLVGLPGGGSMEGLDGL